MRHHLLWAGQAAILATTAGPLTAQTIVPCADCATALPIAAPIAPHRAIRPPAGWEHGELFPRAGAAALPDQWIRRGKSLTAGDDHDSISLRAVRSFARRRSPAEASMFRRDKISTSMLGLRYDLAADGADRLALSLDGGIERRRFASDIADGKWSTSRSMRIRGEWVRDRNWRVSAGYAVTMGSRRLAGPLRGIELSQGAVASRRGIRLGMDFSPSGFEGRTPLTIGFEVGADRLAAADRIALGAPGTNDRRAAVNLKWAF
jgi:hypothetical protein